MTAFKQEFVGSDAAKQYIENCRKWRDEHPRNIRKNPRLAFYPIMGCRIYVAKVG